MMEVCFRLIVCMLLKQDTVFMPSLEKKTFLLTDIFEVAFYLVSKSNEDMFGM